MKIKETTITRDGRPGHFRGICGIDIEVDGELVFRFRNVMPEDEDKAGHIQDAFRIVSYMKKAYKAGKAGKKFKVEAIER